MSSEPNTRPSQTQSNAANTASITTLPGLGENAVVWTVWATYGAFYFCRANISAAVPGLKAPAAEGGLGLSGDEVGWILASLKIAYALGQLVNGQLSERVSPRVLLAIGMFCSAALNVLFGIGAGFFFLLFVWACNGYCQSLGWTPCVRVLSNWVPVARRGKAIGIVGTGYQITLGLTYLVASYSASFLGWRGAMYVPSVLLAATGIFMLLFLKESPQGQALAESSDSGKLRPSGGKRSLAENIFWTLFNPALWLLGLSLALLNACRYGFLDWGITHLMEVQKTNVSKAGLTFFVIAVGAAAGSYLAGWATDRFFGSRRAPVIFILLVSLGVLSLVYESAARTTVTGTMFLLVVIGFCIYGPQVLLVGTAPADLAHRNTSAAAAGFVNFMGYVGAATGNVVTGHFSESQHGGWQVALYTWAGWAFAAAFFSALLWNTTSRKVGLLPSFLPKVGALAALLAASVVVLRSDHPVMLFIVTIVAAACIVGALANRRFAMAGVLLAALGLLVVFTAYVRSNAELTWDQATAMAAYGLSILSGVMVLVDRR